MKFKALKVLLLVELVMVGGLQEYNKVFLQWSKLAMSVVVPVT